MSIEYTRVMLQEVLEGLFDYAGLFPPAGLSLEAAVREYRSFEGTSAELLAASFVCPVGKLTELVEVWPRDEDLAVAIVASEDIEADLVKIHSLPGNFEIASYEAKAGDANAIQKLGKRLSREEFESFLEIPLGPELADSLDAFTQFDQIFPKARLGGTTPGSVPSTELVADFIVECDQLDLSYKLTAGLHHPFPNVNAETRDTQFGFMNILVAAHLCAELDWTRDEVIEALAQPAAAFKWGNVPEFQGQRLNDLASVRNILLSIGSCSIMEPLDDLRAAGITW